MINQFINVVSGGKAFRVDFLLMFCDSIHQIICDTCIQCCIMLIGHNINVATFFHGVKVTKVNVIALARHCPGTSLRAEGQGLREGAKQSPRNEMRTGRQILRDRCAAPRLGCATRSRAFHHWGIATSPCFDSVETAPRNDVVGLARGREACLPAGRQSPRNEMRTGRQIHGDRCAAPEFGCATRSVDFIAGGLPRRHVSTSSKPLLAMTDGGTPNFKFASNSLAKFALNLLY